MTNDELDRIISRKDEILPSSGFVGSVMDSVRQEAATPDAIPFPWRRAIPGIVAAAVTIVSVFIFFALQVKQLERVPAVPLQTAFSELPSAAIPVTAAFLLTIASIMFSRRFTSN